MCAGFCGGAFKGSRPTYAFLDDRVPVSGPVTRDEALANLATVCGAAAP